MRGERWGYRLRYMVLLKLRGFFPRFSAICIAKMHFCIENHPLYILYLLYTMFIEIFLKLWRIYWKLWCCWIQVFIVFENSYVHIEVQVGIKINDIAKILMKWCGIFRAGGFIYRTCRVTLQAENTNKVAHLNCSWWQKANWSPPYLKVFVNQKIWQKLFHREAISSELYNPRSCT